LIVAARRKRQRDPLGGLDDRERRILRETEAILSDSNNPWFVEAFAYACDVGFKGAADRDPPWWRRDKPLD
jgi:hypothetical protein